MKDTTFGPSSTDTPSGGPTNEIPSTAKSDHVNVGATKDTDDTKEESNG